MGIWLGLMGLAAFLFGIVNLIYPIRALGMTARKNGAILAAASLVVFIVGVATTPDTTRKPSDDKTVQASAGATQPAGNEPATTQPVTAKSSPKPVAEPPKTTTAETAKSPAPEEKPAAKTFAFTTADVKARWKTPSLVMTDVPNVDKYGVTGWQRSDLADGTPRWSLDASPFYYEVVGDPKAQSMSLMTGFADDTAHNAEVIMRMAIMVSIMEPNATKADRATILDHLEKLMDAPGEDQVWTTATTRWKMMLVKPLVFLIAEPK